MRKPYTITRGQITATAPTKAEAKAELERQIDRALDRHSPLIERRFDYLVIVSPDPNGWHSTIVKPEDIAHGRAHYSGSVHSPEAERATVIARTRLHAAQLAWTPETNDAEHQAAAGLDTERAAFLVRWIAFQRRYLAEKAGGATDAEAWNRALSAAQTRA